MADADPAEVAAEDPNPTVSLLSARSLETDGDSEDDADFDPVKSGDEASSDDDDDDGSGDDDEDDASGADDASDDDEVARAVKASFLRSFGEPDERIDDDRIAEAAATTVPGDAAADDDALPLGDAEMERLFDTDESDTDEDDSDDEDEDISLVPEESNVLNASAGLLVPGPEYSPSASVSAVTRPPLEKGARASPSESRKSIPRELFPYSPSLKRAAREREEALGEAKSKRSKPSAAEVPESSAVAETRGSGARRALEFDPGRVQGLGPRSAKESGGGGGDERSDDPKGAKSKGLPEAFIGSLEDSDDESENRGVARRTRAHISLADIDLDYIESMMPLPDEGDMGFQFHDDDEEYANFLSAINLDFEVGGDAAGGGETNARRPPATLRDDDDDESDDDDYANVDPKAARVERRARRYQAANAPILAAAADLPDPQKRRTKRKEYTYRYRSKLDRPEYKERPVWSTVVTRNARLRAAAAAAAAAAAKNGTAPGAAGPGAAAGPAALAGPALPKAEFTRAQIGALHAMISDHVQLLLTTFARGAWDIDPVANAAAQRAHRLLGQMLETVKARLMAKDAAKDPPHAEACFTPPPAAAGPNADGARRWVPPPRPGNSRVYTVMDVMPLRMAGKFMADVRACGFVMRVPPGRRLPPVAPPQVMLPPASAAGGLPPAAPRVPSAEELRDAQNAMEMRYGRLSQLFRAEHAEPDEAHFLDDWRQKKELSDAETRRKRRKPPPDEMVPFYVRVPAGVVLASRPFAFCVNPHVLPRVPNLRITWEKDRWLPSEDALLAAGIENYGVRWDVIRVNLLPAKTSRQIINRQKNLCNETRFKGENVVRDAKQKVLQPLSAAEIRAIREVLHRDDAVAGGENWDAIQRERLPNRNASCLDRLWKEAHPRGLVACEPYPEPGAPLLLASAEHVGTAPIDMINSSFHDHNVSIHVPRKAKLRRGAEADAEPARFHPSLFGGDPGSEEPRLDHGGFGGSGARGSPDASPAKAFATRVSPRRRGDAPAASLLFGRLEDSRDTGLGFGMASGGAPASPTAAATQREMARALFSPSKVPEALQSPPKAAATRDRDRDPAHTPGKGVDFEQEALHDTDSDGDDDAARGAWARRGRGRPSRAAMYAEKAMQDRAARVAAEREALPSSDDESEDSLGAEREDIVSSEDERAERSDLEDSDDEDAGERDRPPDSGRVEGGAETRDASAPPPPSILFGSLESTMPLPEDDAFGPFPNRASGTAEAPKQHAWSAEQDHAVLVAAQTRGVSAATWESLAGAGGACRGATAAQVEARFAWLCDAAKKQKCASAARGGKPKGKPRKPKPRGYADT